jgi:glycosyltransferase involved in cell wall biosynthesis
MHSSENEDGLSMYPYVTIIMPIRNEAEFIHRSLAAVLAQDYPSERMELLVADGMSTDGTREIIKQFAASDSRVRMVDNLACIMATGFNTAMLHARGDVIVIVGGHTELSSNYVSRAVSYLRDSGVDCVGGHLETISLTSIGQTIAIAMSSPFGVGGAAFRTQSNVMKEVDTVAFGAYQREIIDLAGLLDEELIRGQDDEYNYRLRKMGAKILQVPDIYARYYSRISLRALWHQYFQYGFWKVRVLQKHPFQMRPRQFIPPAFALALLGSVSLVLFPAYRHLSFAVPLLYLFTNLLSSIYSTTKHGWNYLPLLPLTFAILHLSYGFGFLLGLFWFWKRWNNKTSQVHNLKYEFHERSLPPAD